MCETPSTPERAVVEETTGHTERERDWLDAQMREQRLIARAQCGDQQAFDHLMRQHAVMLRVLAREFIHSGMDWQDLQQIARIAFWDAVQLYDPQRGASFRRFAELVVRRRLWDEVRMDMQHRIPAAYLDDPVTPEPEDERTLSDVLRDGSATDLAEHAAILEEAGALLHRLRSSLSMKQWRVFIMYVRGHSYAEIAEAMQCNAKQVDNTLVRLRSVLRDIDASTEALCYLARELR